MRDQSPNEERLVQHRLVQHWVQVRDDRGRVHLEARWELASTTAPAPATHGHAA